MPSPARYPVWSWNIAASSLEAVIPGFNAKYPDVKVTVEDLGNQQVFDRLLAGCAAGGSGLPDVLSIENHEAEIFWTQFPDCLTDLKTLGYTEEIASGFPQFKRTRARKRRHRLRHAVGLRARR